MPAIFLDRDGVLTMERGHVTAPEDLHLLPGAAEAVARLNRAGWRVFVFTNQSGVGRGLTSPETLEAIHAKLHAEIGAAGGRLEAVYVCPHAPDADCECRKPKPGMLRQAAREHALNLTECVVVGDTPRDIAAGYAVGCRTILVLSGHTKGYDPATFPDPQPDAVYADLLSVQHLDAIVPRF